MIPLSGRISDIQSEIGTQSLRLGNDNSKFALGGNMKATDRKISVRILSVLMSVVMLTFSMISPAEAETATKAEADTYATFMEGTCGAEIGIASDNVISLDSEELVFDFTGNKEPFGDEVMAVTKAEYVLTNTSSKEVTASIAVPELLRVKKVSVNRDEESAFASGRSIMVDGAAVNGLIYVNTTMDRLRKDSVYERDSEILSRVDYKVYFDEGFSMYARSSAADTVNKNYGIVQAPESETVDYYAESENGELCLCSVIYNLEFGPGESKTVRVEGSIAGEMNRATKYTDRGTSYSYAFVGENLNSFYHVGDIRIIFALPEGNSLPLIECDAARYLDNDVWTIHFKGGGNNFSFTVGEVLSKEEINDIYTSNGPGKILLTAAAFVGAALVILSGYYLYYSIKNRKKSGIGK